MLLNPVHSQLHSYLIYTTHHTQLGILHYTKYCLHWCKKKHTHVPSDNIPRSPINILLSIGFLAGINRRRLFGGNTVCKMARCIAYALNLFLSTIQTCIRTSCFPKVLSRFISNLELHPT